MSDSVSRETKKHRKVLSVGSYYRFHFRTFVSVNIGHFRCTALSVIRFTSDLRPRNSG